MEVAVSTLMRRFGGKYRPLLVPDTFEEFAPMRKLFLSLVGLALVASPALAGKYNKKVSVGDKAPTFSGIPATINGEDASLTLSDLKDEVVVLVFLGNHCPVVGMYDDRIIDFTNDYKGKGVKVVAVAVADMDSDKLPAIKEYAKKKGINYVYGYDESQQIGRDYGATNTPHFFVLDKDRVIRYIGAMDDNRNADKVKKNYLRDAVDAVLKGEKVAVEETRADGCGIHYNSK
jgi:peroxiredoxin